MGHLVMHFFGLDNASGPFYLFWSGIAGSFLVGLSVWAGTTWAHRTCHVWWCPRRAMFDFTGPGGFSYRLCRKCHPEHPGERITRKRLYLGRQPGRG